MGVDGAWWLPWSSKPVRPDDVGLGGFDSHALPPSAGVPNSVKTVGSSPSAPVRGVLLVAGCLALAGALPAQQRPDTTRVAIDTAGPKPELRPPLSPRRAFLYSLLLPGYSQSVLGRHRAGSLQLAFEAVSLTMIRLTAADVREARRTRADSIPVSFVNANGQPEIRFERTAFPTSLLRSRRARLEDWIAVLMANHLFSAADGYVAALLWDLPAEVAVDASPQAARLALRVRW
jgi:hypothetical protein